MTSFRLSRRAVLRGAGSIAIALPWLEIMREERPARAADVAAKRFVGVYTPGGTVHASDPGPTSAPILEQWTPTGTETDFKLSRILAPYESIKSKLLVLSGIDMKSAFGEQQQSGLIAWLTGKPQANSSGALGYATGPSIDQVLTSRLSTGDMRSGLELAVRWGTGKTHGKVSPMGVVSFANDAQFSPRPPLVDPVEIWNTLFGSLPPGSANGASFDKSILDYVDKRYVGLSAKLGSADKQRIDQHLSAIRELEQQLAQVASTHCVPPTLIDTSDYNPHAASSDDGSVVDLVTDAAIPKVGKLMLDMLVMALACDRTSVATFMWTDCEAKHTYPWLNLPQTFDFYQNGGGYRPEECAQIGTWYASQNSYLLQQMAAVDMGGHSLLDESVVFFGSEVSHPATHKKLDMPFLLAGGGGGLRTGRWLKYEHVSHNDLLVAILNRFGDDVTAFGDALYCSGTALPNLT